MKKIFFLIQILLAYQAVSYSQSDDSVCYSYKSSFYFERICLLKDGQFDYYQQTEFTKIEVKGNWQVRNDSILVLDSRPQRSKLIVIESLKRNGKTTFKVRDTKGGLMHFNLYAIKITGDTVKYKGHLGEIVTRGQFSAFYVSDSKGLLSPVYEIQGKHTSHFEIFFEPQRTFENEYWRYGDQGIIPLGYDNRYVNYILVK